MLRALATVVDPLEASEECGSLRLSGWSRTVVCHSYPQRLDGSAGGFAGAWPPIRKRNKRGNLTFYYLELRSIF